MRADLGSQSILHADCYAGKGGKVADPPGAAAKKQVVESPSKVAGAKRIKMRYGPYMVPNMNRTGLTGEPGSLWLVGVYASSH